MFNLRSNTLTGLMHGPTSPASRGLAHILSTVFLGANQSLKVAAEVIEKEIGKYPKVPKVLKPLNPAPDGYNNRSFLVRFRHFGLRESHPRILPSESLPIPLDLRAHTVQVELETFPPQEYTRKKRIIGLGQPCSGWSPQAKSRRISVI